jgi:hypothetical protein
MVAAFGPCPEPDDPYFSAAEADALITDEWAPLGRDRLRGVHTEVEGYRLRPSTDAAPPRGGVYP